jgi:hypothetical protein
VESSSHVAESSSHLAVSSSHVVESSSHVAESSSHLAESTSQVKNFSYHFVESSKIKQVFTGFSRISLDFFQFLVFFECFNGFLRVFFSCFLRFFRDGFI